MSHHLYCSSVTSKFNKFLPHIFISSMEYHKMYCSEHPYEPVTNFCTDPQCLVGLCATCICEHTRSHVQRGSSPSYQNIKDAYTRYKDRMREQVELIEQDKIWLNNIRRSIEEKRQVVKSTLSQAREDCLALVNKHFDELETKISAEIVNETKRNSLHSAYRLETLNTLMFKQLSNLLMYSKELSSMKFLQTAKVVEDEVLPNSNDFHMKVCRQLKENQVYTAAAVYKQQFLGDLAHSLKRLVNLEFLLPRVEYVEGPAKVERVDKLDDFKRSMSLRRNNSAVVISSSKPTSDLKICRNVSTVLPKQVQQMVITSNPTNPFYQLQQNLPNFKNEVAASNLHKTSRLSNLSAGLKIIKETNRESSQRDDASSSLTSSRLSHVNKQNETLAKSTYIDTTSSFYR